MTKVIGLASARRSMSVRRSSRNAGSHEMSARNLKAIEGGRDDDLVTTIIRAIDLATSDRSDTTVYLLRMALLNEGIRLADDLSKQAFSGTRKESSLPKLNLVGTEQAIGFGQTTHPEAARPG
jgi:hypothetical protein